MSILRPAIGIDLGTTNTVAASAGSVILHGTGTDAEAFRPSVVAYPPSGRTLVGKPARARRAIDPKNTIYSAKRLMGETYHSYIAQTFRQQYPFDLVDQDGGVAFQTRRGVVTPVDVAATVLHAICVEGHVNAESANVVVTVPAAFKPKQRSATLDAIGQAGFEGAMLIEEPVATAIAYLSRSSLKYGAVYDLGGGTFDLAVLDCSREPYRVVAFGGDTFLGGDDVDRALAMWVAEALTRRERWDLTTDPEVFDRLLTHCELAKRRLSVVETTLIELASIDPAAPEHLEPVELDRHELMSLCTELVKRTFSICDRVLGEAGLGASDIDAVFLAGGSTKLPRLAEQVGDYFGKRARRDVDPMTVVAMGAGLAAARPRLESLLSHE